MAKKVYIDFELRYKEAVANLDEMQKEYTKLENKVKSYDKAVEKSNSSVKENEKNTKKATGSTVAFTGALAGLTGGATATFAAMKAGLVSTIAGFKTLRVAVISSGIGALAIAIISVIQAFKRSEKGQQKFRKLMMQLGAVTDIFMDALAKLGMMIIEVFESPMKVIRPVINLLTSFKDTLIDVFTSPLKYLTQLKDAIVENITMRFEALMASAGYLGEALSELFAGNFRKAMRAGGKAVSKLGDAVTGVEDSMSKLQDGVMMAYLAMERGIISAKQYEKVLNSAADAADKLNKAEVLGRDLIVKRAEADRDRADLLEKSVNKEMFTLQQRIGFLKEAAALEEEITNQEIEVAKIRLEAHQLEMEGTLDTTEALQKEAELKAELIQLETAKLTKQKEVTSQIVSFNAEAKAENDALIAEAKAEEKERADEFLANNVYVFGVGFMPKDQYDQMLADAKQREKEEADRQAQKEKDEADRKAKAIEDSKIQLEKERQIELAKRQMREQTFNNAVQLAGAESRLGKTILLAKQILLAKEAIMNFKSNVIKATAAMGNVTLTAAEAGVQTTSSIAKAANVAPPPFNLPFIATALATAVSVMSAVKAAKSKTKSAASLLGGGGGGIDVSAPNPSISTPPDIESITPQFNTVGASGTNQLAQLLGGEQAPVRAFVVSGDVSTAQEMDRNIVSSASLG